MSASELLYGERSVDDINRPLASLVPDARGVIKISDVEIFYSLFELPMSTTVARLSTSLHPSIPAVMGTSFWRVPASDFGEFQLAYVGLACRTGIKPRHMVIGAWCDNPAAARFFRDRYGFDCQPAEIRCRETYDRVLGWVAAERETILEIVATALVPIVGGGGSVKYSPPLNLAFIGGQTKLAQFEASYDFKRVSRGVVQASTYVASEVGDAAVAPTYPISGTFAVCDVDLLPVRFQVDLLTPAEHGGATKVTGKREIG